MKTIKKAIAFSLVAFIGTTSFAQLNLGLQSTTQAALSATLSTTAITTATNAVTTAAASTTAKAVNTTSMATTAVKDKTANLGPATTINGNSSSTLNANGGSNLNTALASDASIGVDGSKAIDQVHSTASAATTTIVDKTKQAVQTVGSIKDNVVKATPQASATTTTEVNSSASVSKQ